GGCRDSVTDSVAIIALPTPLVSGQTTACTGKPVTYTTAYNAGNTYTWFAGGGTIISGQNADTVNVIWNNTGNYTIGVVETNTNNCFDTATANVTVSATPVQPVVSLGTADTLIAMPDTATAYQWYFNGTAVTGATSSKLPATASGIYTVVASNGNC